MSELNFKTSNGRSVAINLNNAEQLVFNDNINCVEIHMVSGKVIIIILDGQHINLSGHEVTSVVYTDIIRQLFHPNLLAFGN